MKRVEDCDLVLVAGIQGSGKTHLTGARFKGRVRLNKDHLRVAHKEMSTMEPGWDQEHYDPQVGPLLHEFELELLRFHLSRGEKVVIDDTNTKVFLRQDYIRTARVMRKTVGIVFLVTPLEICLARNRTRDNVVPESVVRDYHRQLELPSLEEGFAALEITMH